MDLEKEIKEVPMSKVGHVTHSRHTLRQPDGHNRATASTCKATLGECIGLSCDSMWALWWRTISRHQSCHGAVRALATQPKALVPATYQTSGSKRRNPAVAPICGRECRIRALPSVTLLNLNLENLMSFMPAAKKPVVVSSVFDASVNRMVVTAVFPMRDGKVYVNPLSNEGFVELFFQQPGVITVQHHDEIQVTATEEFWAKLHTMWKGLPSRRNCEIVELESPIPMMSLNIFELSALQMYCQDYGSNVLLQRRDGKLIISSPTCRNPVEVEVHHG